VDKQLLVHTLYTYFHGIYIKITYQVHGFVKQFNIIFIVSLRA